MIKQVFILYYYLTRIFIFEVLKFKMKTKNIFLAVISLLFMVSCADPGGEPIYDGFSIAISNNSDQSYSVRKIIVGGLKNNLFVPTDTIVPTTDIEIRSNYLESVFLDANRWKPDLDKIRNIPSERCYFKLKLSNGREEMLVVYNSTDFFNLKLPNTKNFVGDYGRLFFTIFDTEIIGRAAEME